MQTYFFFVFHENAFEIMSNTSPIFHQMLTIASIAQWIEHWSRKPGVVSSILTGGSGF